MRPPALSPNVESDIARGKDGDEHIAGQARNDPGVLRYPAFRKLLAGLAVSQVGDWLYNLALVALVYDRTHSALWAGITTAARVVPIVVLGPLGGVVADRSTGGAS